MTKIKVSIVGASGYTGGELLRLLLFHPNVEINQVTSESYTGKFVYKVHPNLRKATQLKFSSASELQQCDLLFLCLPHNSSQNKIDSYKSIAPKIIARCEIDLSPGGEISPFNALTCLIFIVSTDLT